MCLNQRRAQREPNTTGDRLQDSGQREVETSEAEVIRWDKSATSDHDTGTGGVGAEDVEARGEDMGGD
jgi:hypothetical protein